MPHKTKKRGNKIATVKETHKALNDDLPPYGAPLLIKINGVVQHITYMRDGADDELDWFEPYFFRHEDIDKLPLHKVDGWFALPDWRD